MDLGVIQNCHHFHNRTPGVSGHHTLLKNVDYDALHFHAGSLKIKKIKSTLGREGGGKKKRVCCVGLRF